MATAGTAVVVCVTLRFAREAATSAPSVTIHTRIFAGDTGRVPANSDSRIELGLQMSGDARAEPPLSGA